MKKSSFLLFFLLFSLCVFGFKSTEMRLLMQSAPVFSFFSDGSYVYVSADGKSIVRKDAKTDVETLVFSIEGRSQLSSIGGFILSPDQATMLVYEKTERSSSVEPLNYFLVDRQRNKLEPLSEYGKQQIPLYSPNGKMIAFVRNGDVYIKRLEFGTELRVTENGLINTLSNGLPDKLYQQGFGINSSIVWSPDSKMIAFVQYDEADVPLFTHTETTTTYPQLFQQRYSKPGFPITKARLFVYTIQFRKHLEMKLPDEGDNYITAVAWSSNPELMAINVLNREQNERKTIFYNPLSGVARMANQENAIPAFSPLVARFLQFLPDNSFTLLSEKTGYTQLYHYANNGILIRQLTNGKMAITDVYGYDTIGKQFFYQSFTKGLLNKGIFAVNLQGKIRTLFDEEGVHTAYFSPQFSHFVHQYSNVNTPPYYTLYDVKMKKLGRVFDNAAMADKMMKRVFPTKELLPMGWMVKPSDFDERKVYPVVVVLQETLNQWDISYAQDIANQGYVVCSFSPTMYRYAGNEQEHLAVWHSYLETLFQYPFTNKNSIALMGVGAYAHTAIELLQKDTTVKVAIALNPITDYAHYLSVLSEGWMGLPQKNFMAYQQAELSSLANYRGKLLLMHNVDNTDVHIQHTWLLVDALIKANQQFDMQLYPSIYYDNVTQMLHLHSFERIMSFLNKNM